MLDTSSEREGALNSERVPISGVSEERERGVSQYMVHNITARAHCSMSRSIVRKSDIGAPPTRMSAGAPPSLPVRRASKGTVLLHGHRGTAKQNGLDNFFRILKI